MLGSESRMPGGRKVLPDRQNPAAPALPPLQPRPGAPGSNPFTPLDTCLQAGTTRNGPERYTKSLQGEHSPGQVRALLQAEKDDVVYLQLQFLSGLPF